MKTVVKYKIPFYLCDLNGILRLDGLVKLFVETSIQNSFDVEGHFDSLWILYRWYIEVFDDINWTDEIEIHTYLNRIEGYLAYRNFEIYKDGKLISRAQTKWLLLNHKTKRVIKIPRNFAEIYGEYGGFNSPKEEIKALDIYTDKKKIMVRKSDLDKNAHVNNAAYLQYLYEGVDLENKKVKTIEIIYKKEIKYGDDIELEYINKEDEYQFVLKKGDVITTIGRLTFR